MGRAFLSAIILIRARENGEETVYFIVVFEHIW
jgi:hypothetical protein